MRSESAQLPLRPIRVKENLDQIPMYTLGTLNVKQKNSEIAVEESKLQLEAPRLPTNSPRPPPSAAI
jgi:hypothetical protein